MSLELAKAARLPGYTGPVSVPELHNLHALLDKLGDQVDVGDLQVVAEETPGYLYNVGLEPTTTDGYSWYWGAAFSFTPGREIIMLIPFKRDKEMRNGSSFDRAIGLYWKGLTTENDLQVLLRDFETSMRARFRCPIVQPTRRI